MRVCVEWAIIHWFRFSEGAGPENTREYDLDGFTLLLQRKIPTEKEFVVDNVCGSNQNVRQSNKEEIMLMNFNLFLLQNCIMYQQREKRDHGE